MAGDHAVKVVRVPEQAQSAVGRNLADLVANRKDAK